MSQQKIIFQSLEDFQKSDKNDLIHIGLKFSQFKVDSQELIQISSQIALCTEIQSFSLDLQSQNIQDEQIKLLMDDLPAFKKLNDFQLYLNRNDIQDDGAQVIGRVLLHNYMNLTSLQLSFYSNNICDRGAQLIATGLSKCTQLASLNFNFFSNFIGDEGVYEIGTALRNCKNLVALILYLDDNNITDEGYLKFDQCIQELPKLSTFQCFLKQSEKLLKSRDLVNCKNIKVLTLSLYYCKLRVHKIYHKQKALKIKRLVKLSLN
ncbi:hypothetical protein ABPG72_021190 [Tetrahymena utriculariae]